MASRSATGQSPGGCDVKAGVREMLDNSPPGPMVDDLVEVLMWQHLMVYGFGFPPHDRVVLEVPPDRAGRA